MGIVCQFGKSFQHWQNWPILAFQKILAKFGITGIEYILEWNEVKMFTKLKMSFENKQPTTFFWHFYLISTKCKFCWMWAPRCLIQYRILLTTFLVALRAISWVIEANACCSLVQQSSLVGTSFWYTIFFA